MHRGNKRLPPDAITQYFRNHGWIVGHRPNADICPMCITAGKRRHLKLVPQEEETMAINKSPLSATTMLTPMVLAADPPRSMSREERRIITDKLDSIYVDGRYAVPWNDAKTARDLGVPQAWVAEVRDQFFGPEGSNPEIDAFLEKLEPMTNEAKGYIEQARRQADALTKLIAEADGKFNAAQTLVRSISDLTGRVSDLEQLATKLRKETGK